MADNYARYRMIGISGHYDKRTNNKEDLIADASKHTGVFTLWSWSGRIWNKVETFIF
jgi:hypothetical protein